MKLTLADYGARRQLGRDMEAAFTEATGIEGTTTLMHAMPSGAGWHVDTEDLLESFTADITSSSSSIPDASLLAIGSHGDGHLTYWHATPSGGIVSAQKSPSGEWKKGDVAPDGSIAPGGSLQAASREPGKIDLLRFSPTGVPKGRSSIVDVISTSTMPFVTNRLQCRGRRLR
ncbi:hypothetical protein PEBR_35139 [Penicillium brasilianum]|uniref:Uncharacterized protein n=1 Tax=Penicillium brasilianum TaxID=104259 RepID=A0A1S9RD87_PENBI|nr:hypothetical protein PEBR_35139 [Penicillium brasilianum]